MTPFRKAFGIASIFALLPFGAAIAAPVAPAHQHPKHTSVPVHPKKAVLKKHPLHKTPVKKVVKKPAPIVHKKPIVKTPVKIAHPMPVRTHIAPNPVAPPVVAVPALEIPPSGVIAASENMPYSFGAQKVSLTGAEFTDKNLPNLFGPIAPDAGTHYVVFTLRVQNAGTEPVSWTFERFNPTVQTDDPAAKPLRGQTLLTATNARFETQPIQPGEEKVVRFHFQVPLTAHLRSLTLTPGGGAEYRFDLSGLH
jgi:hypothetical protein